MVNFKVGNDSLGYLKSIVRLRIGSNGVTEKYYFDIVFVTYFSPYCMDQIQDTLNSGNQSLFSYHLLLSYFDNRLYE